MKRIPDSIQAKLNKRLKDNALREFTKGSSLIDFASNDYLGFANSPFIFDQAKKLLEEYKIQSNGSTGSRLISGNHLLYTDLENYLSEFHAADNALIFNSGYDANLGLLASVPQRGDLIFYDEYSHASIRDGLRLSQAKAYKFQHNDLQDLEKRLTQFQSSNGEKYIVTESVFSMDGDIPDLSALCDLASQYKAYLIIDEAHATGVIGPQGKGLVQQLGLENQIFARIHTFGKAIGAHGAVVLGTDELKSFLINFARSLIYTTALAPHTLATVFSAYQVMKDNLAIKQLKENIRFFQQLLEQEDIESSFIKSKSAIQSCIIPGNDQVKRVARELQAKGFDIKAILSPTVPEGKERLRICLHSFNQKEKIEDVINSLSKLLHQ